MVKSIPICDSYLHNRTQENIAIITQPPCLGTPAVVGCLRFCSAMLALYVPAANWISLEHREFWNTRPVCSKRVTWLRSDVEYCFPSRCWFERWWRFLFYLWSCISSSVLLVCSVHFSAICHGIHYHDCRDNLFHIYLPCSLWGVVW